MSAFAIAGRYSSPLPPDWRDRLAARLGQRPRRIGLWAELALFGALECLSDAGESILPERAALLVASRKGALSATQAVLEQGRDGLPMPLTFLQTQPSQMLAVLANQLSWNGCASFVAGPDPDAMLSLAAAQAGAEGVLLGWVDEGGQAASSWLRLCPAAEGRGFQSAAVAEIFSRDVSQLRVTEAGLEVARA